MARTTCQSFSISPSPPGRSLLAISSTRRRSNTLEAHDGTVISDLASDTSIDTHAPPGGHLGGLAVTIGLFEFGGRRPHAKAAQSFVGQVAQTFDWRRCPVDGRKPCPRIESRANLQQS